MSDEKLDRLVQKWEAAQGEGRTVSLEELCADAPELREPLLLRIRGRIAEETLADGDSTPASAPDLIARSEIEDLKFLAKGGLGAVYTATERALHRRVAVKFIHGKLADDEESRSRFALEAEVTGRLEHPGIVPLYGAGKTIDGRPFYYMRFIDGSTLDDAINSYHASHESPDSGRSQGVEFRSLLQCLVSLCKTVAYAHTRGIVHRDIKPQNVMLGRYGETIVVDWGLAVPVVREERFRVSDEMTLKPSSGNRSGSSSGVIEGTPAYMSPEQMSGLLPNPGSDIYSLGATLYKTITGVPPFSRGSATDLKHNVIEGRFPRPSSIRPGCSRSLEAICLKAMAREPQDRYATALELAADLENYLADAPVSVLVESLPRRVARWTRRNWRLVQIAFLSLVGILIMSGILTVVTSVLAGLEHRARNQAERSRVTAEEARRKNLQSSARFLARSLAYEIDLRWRILEAEANSLQLRELIKAANRDPQNADLRKPLQSWLEKRYIANEKAPHSECWYMIAADGTQVARCPEAASVGNNFTYRDYFHGQGRDLPEGSPEALAAKPFRRPAHMSAVYESFNTHTLNVAFSVPIWSDPPEVVDREPIGILAMSVGVGAFDVGRNAILFDARVDQIENKPGMILHHSQLGARSTSDLPPRVGGAPLDTANHLRRRRLRDSNLEISDDEGLLPDFVDPILKRKTLAALDPVIIPGRDDALADSGWVVIVTEPSKQKSSQLP